MPGKGRQDKSFDGVEKEEISGELDTQDRFSARNTRRPRKCIRHLSLSLSLKSLLCDFADDYLACLAVSL